MLGDDIAWALPQLREQAESNMRDQCTITRASLGNGDWNPETGQYHPRPSVTVYTGKCRIQIVSENSTDTDAGGREWSTQASVIQLPVLASTEVAVNDVVKVTACDNDPSLIDREFTIAGRHGKSQATARRLRMEEVTG